MNARATFTPGPWTLGSGYECAREHAVCSGHSIIAKVVGFGYPVGSGWSPESAANARLMVEAPAMADALRELRKQLRAHVKLDVRRHYSLMVADAAAGSILNRIDG